MKAPTIAQINAMGFQNKKQFLCWLALQLDAGSKGYGPVTLTNPATPATPLKIAENKPATALYRNAVSIDQTPRQSDPQEARGKEIDLYMKFPISRAAVAVGAIGSIEQINPKAIFSFDGDKIDLTTWLGVKPSSTPTTHTIANCFGVNLTGLTSVEQMFVETAKSVREMEYVNETIDGVKYARAMVSVGDMYLPFGAANLLQVIDEDPEDTNPNPEV